MPTIKLEKYVCECGKVFNNSQSFNGHKSHCKIHYLAKYGNDTDYNNMLTNLSLHLKKGQTKHATNCQIKKELELQQWILEQHKCEKCGKIMTEKFGSGRFCCRACANSREYTEETRQKVSKNNTLNYCKCCNKLLYRYNKSGYCRDCCRTSSDRTDVRIAAGKKGYNLHKENYKGWQTRNIISYAEKFWTEVLNNNGIIFQKEFPVKHNNSNYFLDFYIQKNEKHLDLEIDGKQHKNQDRAKSDKERDEYLINCNYIIYRIAWNEINSEQGKLLMTKKINDFLEFYNKL